MKTRKTLIEFLQPPGMEVYNAPRPLPGDTTWTGDFIAGCFYAAIDPTGPDYDRLKKQIGDLDGTLLIKVTNKEIIREMANYYRQNYPDLDFDEKDPKTQKQMIEAWYNTGRHLE